jgi:threonine synthase
MMPTDQAPGAGEAPADTPVTAGARSTLTHLTGSLSGRRYDADEFMTVDPMDGRPLLPTYDLEAAGRTLSADALTARRSGGLWRWAEILPVREPGNAIWLGEGSTPLVPMRRLGRELGVGRLLFKLEGLNPTGSFKARGMATAVSRGIELGARSFVAPSAGNAAGALAAYAAAANVPATVIMPADAPPDNQLEVRAFGAELILVDGLISDCGRLAARLASSSGAFDVSTLKEPYRVEGKKTLGLELVEDLGWRVPDVIIYPTGGGTGLVGMWKGFAELEALGLIGEERPRLVSVQTEGCAPIVRAFERGEEFATPWVDASTRAGGLRVPSAVGDFLILRAIRESGGTAVAVSEDALDDMQSRVGRAGAGYVSPETAAAIAAIPELKASGFLSKDEEVVVFDTGIGYKYPPHEPLIPAPRVVPADKIDDLRIDPS